jgi:hypothetical protein
LLIFEEYVRLCITWRLIFQGYKEIRKLKLQGKSSFLILADAGFVCCKYPITVPMLRDRTIDAHGTTRQHDLCAQLVKLYMQLQSSS